MYKTILVIFAMLAALHAYIEFPRTVPLLDWTYTAENSYRFFMGEIPYTQLGLVLTPGTYLIQAGLMKLFGVSATVQRFYVCVGAFFSLILANLILQYLLGKNHWALLFTMPLVFGGAYIIFPFPTYDNDVGFSLLLSTFLLLKFSSKKDSQLSYFLSGVALTIPYFFKQNIGIAFATAFYSGFVLFWLLGKKDAGLSKILWMVTGSVTVLATAAATLRIIGGPTALERFYYWTMQFPYESRILTNGGFLSILVESYEKAMGTHGVLTLCFWTITLALVIKKRLSTLALVITMTIYFALSWGWSITIAGSQGMVRHLVEWWPVTLFIGLGTLTAFWKSTFKDWSSEKILMIPVFLGVLLSACLAQRFQGSTYAFWPILMIVWGAIFALLNLETKEIRFNPIALFVPAVLSLLLAAYTANLGRRTFFASEGTWSPAQHPRLKGLGTRGNWLKDIENLSAWIEENIPKEDKFLSLPGEDPIYFVTGRKPVLPIFQFLEYRGGTCPYTAEEILEMAKTENVHWIILKNKTQYTGYRDFSFIRKYLAENGTLVKELSPYIIYRL